MYTCPTLLRSRRAHTHSFRAALSYLRAASQLSAVHRCGTLVWGVAALATGQVQGALVNEVAELRRRWGAAA